MHIHGEKTRGLRVFASSFCEATHANGSRPIVCSKRKKVHNIGRQGHLFMIQLVNRDFQEDLKNDYRGRLPSNTCSWFYLVEAFMSV